MLEKLNIGNLQVHIFGCLEFFFFLSVKQRKAERILSKDLKKKRVLAKYLVSKSIDYIKYECSEVFL